MSSRKNMSSEQENLWGSETLVLVLAREVGKKWKGESQMKQLESRIWARGPGNSLYELGKSAAKLSLQAPNLNIAPVRPSAFGW